MACGITRRRCDGRRSWVGVRGCLVTCVAVPWPTPVLDLTRNRVLPSSLHPSLVAGAGGAPWLSCGFCPREKRPHSLHASPSQVSLLFTSYLVVTAVAMLGVGAVPSRIGPKRTLIAGLTLIAVFAALAGSSSTISGIVGFRAGSGQHQLARPVPRGRRADGDRAASRRCCTSGAHASPSWWARRRRPTGPVTTARSRACRAVSPRTSPARATGRAESEKRAGRWRLGRRDRAGADRRPRYSGRESDVRC